MDITLSTTTPLEAFPTASMGSKLSTSRPKLFLTVIIKTAVSWAPVTSLYNRLFNALGSSRMRHGGLPSNELREPSGPRVRERRPGSPAPPSRPHSVPAAQTRRAPNPPRPAPLCSGGAPGRAHPLPARSLAHAPRPRHVPGAARPSAWPPPPGPRPAAPAAPLPRRS